MIFSVRRTFLKYMIKTEKVQKFVNFLLTKVNLTFWEGAKSDYTYSEPNEDLKTICSFLIINSLKILISLAYNDSFDYGLMNVSVTSNKLSKFKSKCRLFIRP